MKVFVTGVAGVLGSALARELIQQGHKVVGLDNLVGGYESNIPQEIEFVHADGRDLAAVSEAMKGADAVFHSACTAYEGLSVFSPHFVTDNTFGLTVSVATAAIANGVHRFVHCSSMARYGTQEETPFREDMDPKPQDPYGIAKLSSEKVLWNLSEVHGMETVVLVPHNIIGPGQRYDDPYRNVAAIMINRILHGKSPIIYGDGSQVRCFSYIDDVVAPMALALSDPRCVGETINVGPDEGEVTILQLAQLIMEKMSWTQDPIFMPGRPQEVHHATCSADLSRKLLDYEPSMSLEEGIDRLIEWIDSQPRLPFTYDLPIEIRSEKLPDTWSKALM